jgi:hypothetical protein
VSFEHVGKTRPLEARLSASNGFNARALSIEFAGNFRSADGKWWLPETYGRNHLTAEQAESGRRLLRMLNALGVRFVFAHRQSYHSRENDPGPEVWAQVGRSSGSTCPTAGRATRSTRAM